MTGGVSVTERKCGVPIKRSQGGSQPLRTNTKPTCVVLFQNVKDIGILKKINQQKGK